MVGFTSGIQNVRKGVRNGMQKVAAWMEGEDIDKNREAAEAQAKARWKQELTEHNVKTEEEAEKKTAARIDNLTKLLTDLDGKQLKVIINILSIYDTESGGALVTANDVATALINAIDKSSNKICIYLRVISSVLEIPLDSNKNNVRDAAIEQNFIKKDACCVVEESVHWEYSSGCSGCIDLILDKLNIEKDMVMILYWATMRSEDNDKELQAKDEAGGQEARAIFDECWAAMHQLVKKRKEEKAAAERGGAGGQKKSKRRNSKKKKTRRKSKRKKTKRKNKKGKKTTIRRK